MRKILLIEDDKTLKETLKFNLEKEGYIVTVGSSVAQAVSLLTQKYDLAILDVNLPDGKGYEIANEITAYYKETAVVFLTANDMEQDILTGYENGASDYITKPFSLEIFLKKIRAILLMLSPNLENIYNDGGLNINFTTYNSTLDGNVLVLTPMEYKILAIFIKNKNQVLTRNKLLNLLWEQDDNFVDEHALTASISRIRKKIEGRKEYFKTIYGVGYVWQEVDDE